MTNTIPNVPRVLKPVLAMILNALDRDAADGKQARAEMAAELRALISTQSPAGVDGMGNTAKLLLPALRQYMHNDGSGLLAGYDLETTQAIIDGLRGEVADLRSMLATVSKAGLRVRTERDQHAKRIGELEGLLREVHWWIDESARVYRHNSTSVMLYRIDAALSAGKEGE